MSKFESAWTIGNFLLHQRLRGFQAPLVPELGEATDFFRERLGESRCYLEFGSGGSTVAADGLGRETISVECDPYFARAVRKALRPDSPVQLLVINIGLTRPWGFPVWTRPTPRRKEKWRRYSSAPFDIIKKRGIYPDFVLVDGRFRRACALNAARTCAEMNGTTTIMFDDYYIDRRNHYHSVEEFLGAPRRIGRSAIFEISRKNKIKPPSNDDIEEAIADFR